MGLFDRTRSETNTIAALKDIAESIDGNGSHDVPKPVVMNLKIIKTMLLEVADSIRFGSMDQKERAKLQDVVRSLEREIKDIQLIQEKIRRVL
ncbi:MAG: hypothetical protein HYS81_04900 [Candidatus Aenigmatarchaeota archaeon]|nr:MAG: hypothetical protein HYS81_04900 [Candidatus Aenigmarchaeota archaeon]